MYQQLLPIIASNHNINATKIIIYIFHLSGAMLRHFARN